MTKPTGVNKSPKLVEIFTDGACSGNPGPGGWAALLMYNGHSKKLSGGERLTTNNRMELTAAIMALEALKKPCKVRLTTDSLYVMKGITEWLANWKKRCWKTSGNSAVKNMDLWKRLDQATQIHEIEWCWTRGHDGHEHNEFVDSLARAEIKRLISGGVN